MDGHECPDVVEYRDNIFLPAMAKFKACMVQYESLDLKQSEPRLQHSHGEIIVLYHNESCFHANDFHGGHVVWL